MEKVTKVTKVTGYISHKWKTDFFSKNERKYSLKYLHIYIIIYNNIYATSGMEIEMLPM